MRVRSRNQKFVIEAVYASWTRHDLATIGMCIDDDAEWVVHLPPGAWHLSGSVRTKHNVMRSLRAVVASSHDQVSETHLRVRIERYMVGRWWRPRRCTPYSCIAALFFNRVERWPRSILAFQRNRCSSKRCI